MPRSQTMALPNVGRTEKLSARVCREIENAILNDGLSPTTRLPTEGELCRSFGVSRTVVREALQQLTARGIVYSVPGSGSYVASSTLSDLERCLTLLSRLNPDQKAFLELLDLRLLVETETAGRVAASPSATYVRAARAALAEMKANFENHEAFARADSAFHLAIIEAADHALFAAILKPLAPLARRYGLETYDSLSTRQAYREHRTILRHIVAGDSVGARAAMTDHLAASRQHYLEMLEQQSANLRASPSAGAR